MSIAKILINIVTAWLARPFEVKSICISLVFISPFWVTSVFAQSDGDGLLSTFVEGKELSGKTLSSVLSEIARDSKVPLGFVPKRFAKERPGLETSRDLVNEEKGLQYGDGTLENALNQLVGIYSDYEWKYEDGVVSVYPKGEKDDVLLELLTTKISEIRVEKRRGVMSVGGAIADTVEAKAKLKSLGITDMHFFDSVESRKFDRRNGRAYFVIENKTVRDILNQIVRESGSRFWTIVRWGDDGEYLTIIVS